MGIIGNIEAGPKGSHCFFISICREFEIAVLDLILSTISSSRVVRFFLLFYHFPYFTAGFLFNCGFGGQDREFGERINHLIKRCAVSFNMFTHLYLLTSIALS